MYLPPVALEPESPYEFHICALWYQGLEAIVCLLQTCLFFPQTRKDATTRCCDTTEVCEVCAGAIETMLGEFGSISEEQDFDTTTRAIIVDGDNEEEDEPDKEDEAGEPRDSNSSPICNTAK